jgi:two-component system chemotaxis response regulator CheY
MQVDGKSTQRTCKVLIIEDDVDDAYLLKRALNKASSESGVTLGVTHSVNGLDALGAVARSDMMSVLPDVIVVDLNMPIMDGGRFLRLLRSEMLLADVPTAVLTTSTEKPVHDNALACGADAVFSKPSTQDELVVIARKILNMGGHPAPGTRDSAAA